MAGRARWRVSDGQWFVNVTLTDRGTLVDARRVIVALKQGRYVDDTGNPEYSRKVLETLVRGQAVAFTTNSATDHSLNWSVGTKGAIVEVSVFGEVLRLTLAAIYIT